MINESLNGKVVVWLNGKRMLGISNACNGQVLYPLFSAFILATQSHWLNKILMLLVGNGLIFFTNVGRIIGLILIKYYKPNWLDFNHKYTFMLIVYGLIFILWMVWVQKFSEIQLMNYVKNKTD
jgi:exosortase/archaeosortase family protein